MKGVIRPKWKHCGVSPTDRHRVQDKSSFWLKEKRHGEVLTCHPQVQRSGRCDNECGEARSLPEATNLCDHPTCWHGPKSDFRPMMNPHTIPGGAVKKKGKTRKLAYAKEWPRDGGWIINNSFVRAAGASDRREDARNR